MRSRLEFYESKAKQAERRAALAANTCERLDYLFVARQWWEVAADVRFLESLCCNSEHDRRAGPSYQPLDGHPIEQFEQQAH